MNIETSELNIQKKLRRIPEFKGVVFWDITPILKDKILFKEIIKRLVRPLPRQGHRYGGVE